jgi:ATP-dependent RNA helicase DeaD
MDHLEKGTLDLSQLRFLVLDEADEMLKMGFAEDVETILSDTPDDKHVALFSATMPSQIRRISKKYLHDPVEITVKNIDTISTSRRCGAYHGLPAGTSLICGRRQN